MVLEGRFSYDDMLEIFFSFYFIKVLVLVRKGLWSLIFCIFLIVVKIINIVKIIYIFIF